jgi:hypothetical protein
MSAGVFGRLDPHAGTGTLYYYDNAATSRVGPAATFRVTATPWRTTGLQPIVWELIPNYDWESKPILRIALSREARLEWDNEQFSAPYRPLVIIYRPQDNQLMPTPGMPLEPHRMVAEPYTWFPGSEPFATPHSLQPRYFEPYGAADTAILPEWVYQGGRNYAHVMPVALGAVFTEARSLWQVEVLCHQNQPGAFAYELTPTEHGYHLRIVRTSNVRVRIKKSSELEDEPESQLLVQEMVARQLSQVPPQGSRLDLTRYRYRTVTKTAGSTSAAFEPKAITLETRIGFIPMRPALFDMARFVMTAGTGEDKLKSKVEEKSVLPLAIICLFKTTLSSTVLDELIESLAKKNAVLKKLKNKEFLEGIQEQTEYALFEAFQAITASTERKLPDLIKPALSGADALDKLIMLLNDEIGEDYIALAEWRKLARLFSADMQGFQNPRLAMHYRHYLSNQTQPSDPRHNPLDWASDQTSGRLAAELVRELGRQYSQRLHDAINVPMAPTLPASGKTLFQTLATTIDTVATLQERIDSWLHAFTADPLIEDRFLTSDRISSVIERSDAPAAVLPKNPWIAKQLNNYGGYSQVVKSWYFNYLIPPGKEDDASIQQWWDAHVYVYTSLGANTNILQRLRDPFSQIAQNTGERISYRTKFSAEHFTPTHNWTLM